MDELRSLLDATLEKHFPPGFLDRRWEDDDTLHLSGPGADGSIVFSQGRLTLRVALRPPASLMRPAIERKIEEVLQAVAGDNPVPPSPASP